MHSVKSARTHGLRERKHNLPIRERKRNLSNYVIKMVERKFPASEMVGNTKMFTVGSENLFQAQWSKFTMAVFRITLICSIFILPVCLSGEGSR